MKRSQWKSQMKSPAWKNEHGLTLTEILIVAGIGGIVGLMVASVQFMALNTRTKAEAIDWLHQTRAEAMRALQSERAWAQTIDHNLKDYLGMPALDCVKNRTSCAGRTGGPLVLYDTTGERLPQFADPSDSKTGHNNRGEPCTGFDEKSGNPSCPFRYEVTWQPLCSASDPACKYPQIEVTGTLKYAPGSTKQTIHPAFFNFRVAKAEYSEKISATCNAIRPNPPPGATPWPDAADCTFLKPDDCKPGEIVVGFNPDGSLICDGGTSFVCPFGTVLTKIDATGNIVCSPGCDGTQGTTGSLFNPDGSN